MSTKKKFFKSKIWECGCIRCLTKMNWHKQSQHMSWNGEALPTIRSLPVFKLNFHSKLAPFCLEILKIKHVCCTFRNKKRSSLKHCQRMNQSTISKNPQTTILQNDVFWGANSVSFSCFYFSWVNMYPIFFWVLGTFLERLPKELAS